MLALVALASMLVADEPPVAPPGPPSASARAEYDQIKAGAGRTPEAQVRLAYWCEANGLSAERLRHLSQAVLADPTNAAARGLLGLVARDGRWARPEAVAADQAADADRAALLADYDRKRSATPYTADAQLDLGVWADENGLKDQARAHYTAATRLDPRKDVAWKRLGYKKHDGRWRTDAQVAAEKADADAQKDADRKWVALLGRWRNMLGQPSKRAEAEANLLSVTDPRAVPAIARVFGRAEADQARAVQLLGQVDSIAASRGLAIFAVAGNSAEVRRLAAETLRGRDAREFADLLIARIARPIRYQVRQVEGPGKPGRLFIEGKDYNLNRVYAPPAAPLIPWAADWVSYDANGSPIIDVPLMPYSINSGRIVASDLLKSGIAVDAGQAAQQIERRAGFVGGLAPASSSREGQAAMSMIGQMIAKANEAKDQARAQVQVQLHNAIQQVGRAEHKDTSQYGFALSGVVSPVAHIPIGKMMADAQNAAVSAQQQLDADVMVLESMNREIAQTNDRAVQTLIPFTGKDLGTDPGPWRKWWVDQLGYRYALASESDKPTFTEEVPLAYQPSSPTLIPVTATTELVGFQRMSCFGAGTPVQTIAGPRPIETLKVGDLVLTQSTNTGALGYQPVLVTHHNPPGTTFRIKVDGDEIVSSDFHRFWVAGRGWVMARNLQAGDRLRTLGGVVPVEAVEPGKVEPVFNLDVAEDADFFAGRSAALVHDNTLPDPRLVPFDAPAATPKAVAAR